MIQVNFVKSCKVIDDDILNTSDHLPVFVELFYNLEKHNAVHVYLERRNWPKCDKMLYCKSLECIMSKLPRLSNDNTRKDDITTYSDSIQQSIRTAVNSSVPKYVFKPYKRPYWDDELSRAHSYQKQLRLVWISAGRPRGMQHDIYRQYKDAKKVFGKLLHSKEEEFNRKRFTDIDNRFDIDNLSIWKILRHNSEKDSPLHHVTRNGTIYSTPCELRELWKDHFSTLLNEQPEESELYDNEFKNYVNSAIDQMMSTYSSSIDNTGILEVPFTVSEVAQVCRGMPNNKAAGYDGLS